LEVTVNRSWKVEWASVALNLYRRSEMLLRGEVERHHWWES